MEHHFVIGGIVLLLLFVLAVVLTAWKVTTAYSSVIVIAKSFSNTQRYVPDCNSEDLLSLDSIEIGVVSSTRMGKEPSFIRGKDIEKIVQDNLILPLTDTIISAEESIFELPPEVSARKMRRQQYPRSATLENLAGIFFRQLAPLILDINGTLTKVTLKSNDLQIEYSRHKLTNYSIRK